MHVLRAQQLNGHHGSRLKRVKYVFRLFLDNIARDTRGQEERETTDDVYLDLIQVLPVSVKVAFVVERTSKELTPGLLVHNREQIGQTLAFLEHCFVFFKIFGDKSSCILWQHEGGFVDFLYHLSVNRVILLKFENSDLRRVELRYASIQNCPLDFSLYVS